MNIISISFSIVAIIIATITLAATVELFANVRSLQENFGLDNDGIDEEIPLLQEVTKSVMARVPSDIGLSMPDGDDLAYGFILFLSTRCSTCLSLVKHIKDNIPLGLKVALVGDSPYPSEWLRSLEADSLIEVMIDVDRELFDQIYLPITPAVLSVIEGKMAFVVAIDSARSLDRIIVDRFIPQEAISMRVAMTQDSTHEGTRKKVL